MSTQKISARHQQPGEFDPAFNDGKLLVIPGDIAAAIAIDPQGKIYVAGATGIARGGYMITALNPDGSRNQDFNHGEPVANSFLPGAYAQGLEITLLPDGKILLIGLVLNIITDTIMLGMARYHPNGTLDQSFGTSGHVVPPYSYENIHIPAFNTEKDPTPDYVDYNPRHSLVVDDNGKIYVALKGIHNRKNLTLIMHFDESGNFIRSFGNNGTALIEHPAYHTVLAQLLKIDRHLYLAGYLGTSTRQVYRAWARLDMSGKLDLDFGIDGFVFGTSRQDEGEIGKLILQKNSKLLGAGGLGLRETAYSGTAALVSLNRDGTRDMDFNDGNPALQPSEEGRGSFWADCAIQPDGRIVTCGISHLHEQDIIVGRHLPNGKPDTSFNDKGWTYVILEKGINRAATALQNNNAIVVTSDTSAPQGNTSFVFQLKG